MIKITNEDNMQLMARYEDNHFDLAIVDPPYGIDIGNDSRAGKSFKTNLYYENRSKKCKRKYCKRNVKAKF